MAVSTTTTTFQSSSSSSLRGSSNRNGKSGSHAIMERLLLSLVLVSFALLAMSASTGEQLRTAVPSIANIHNTRTTVTSSQTRRLSSSPTTHNNNNNNDVYETSSPTSPPTVVSDLAWLEQHILKPLVVDIGVVMLCHMVGMPAFVQVGGLLQKVRHVVRPLSKIKLPLVRRLQKTVSKLYKNRQRMAAASDLTHLIEEDCDGSICSLAQ